MNKDKQTSHQNIKKRPKLIVMPFTPENDQEYSGMGLGIHFFFGNIISIHTGLEEFWFGWRVKRLFPEIKLLKAYCKGDGPKLDILNLAKEHEVRYWLEGKYKQSNDMITLSLSLHDINEKIQTHKTQLTINVNDDLSDCNNMFFEWIAQCNLPLSEAHRTKALWSEKINIKGLKFLGDALETTYLSYIDPSIPTDIDKFESAVSSSPESYLTHDLLAWALYKRKDYDSAIKSFNTAISLNENGLGALSGLMWCAIFKKNETQACKYAFAKADVRNEGHEKAKAFVAKKFDSNL